MTELLVYLAVMAVVLYLNREDQSRDEEAQALKETQSAYRGSEPSSRD